MKVIYRPRQGGKTTEIIKIAAENFSYIVCMNQEECSRIAIRAAKMGLNIPFPISFYELKAGQFFAKGIKSFVVDNADMLIQDLTRGVEVKAISVTCEEEVSKSGI